MFTGIVQVDSCFWQKGETAYPNTASYLHVRF